MNALRLVAIVAACSALPIACGSSAPPPPPPKEPVTPTATTSATAAATTPPAASAANPAFADPEEVNGVIELKALYAKDSKPTFPKGTVGDQACWAGQEIDGSYDKDWENITAKCVAPTGLVEYTKPVTGKLHHQHDKRDEFSVKLLGKYCYRYFAVADGTMKDLDILVEKPGGDLVADDKTTSPVAIIHSRDVWCMDEDQELHFKLEVDGPGEGRYKFGVFFRKNK